MGRGNYAAHATTETTGQAPRLPLRKRVVYGLVAVALLSSLTLAVLELAVRCAFGQGRVLFLPRLNVPPLYVRSTAAGLAYELAPRYGGLAFGAPVSVNECGLRGTTPPMPVGEDRLQVTLLGDSTCFGFGVSDDDCLAKRLDEYLASSLSSAVEVVNGGVPGYNLSQETAFFEARLACLRPDLLVLIFDANDLGDPYFLRKDWGVSHLTAHPTSSNPLRVFLKGLVLDNSYLVGTLRYRWHVLAGRYDPGSTPNDNLQSRENQVLIEKVTTLAKLVVGSGTKILVCPSVDRFYRPFAGAFDELRRQGIPVFVLLRDSEWSSLGWNPHADATTHDLMARRLAERCRVLLEGEVQP